jgi:L,D-transpeptidase ErfK/SrfK
MGRTARFTLVLAVLLLQAGCATPPPPPAAVAAPERPPVAYTLVPGQVSIGAVSVHITRQDDTLLDVARTYDLGYTQLIAANRNIDPWLPPPGQAVTLPAAYLLPDVPHDGIVVNLVQHRLFYFPKGTNTVETFPIGVGVQGRATPLGVTRVTGKEVHPVWVPPPSIRAEEPDLPRIVPAGPDNPLGDYALTLGWPRYLIHGTNKPDGVGRNVSHGCIHLYPEDMARLFAEVPVGTPVRVIDREAVTAWLDGSLYLAIFPNKQQADQLDMREPVAATVPADLKSLVARAAHGRAGQIDWAAVDAAARDRSGVPIRIATSQFAVNAPAPGLASR